MMAQAEPLPVLHPETQARLVGLERNVDVAQDRQTNLEARLERVEAKLDNVNDAVETTKRVVVWARRAVFGLLGLDVAGKAGAEDLLALLAQFLGG